MFSPTTKNFDVLLALFVLCVSVCAGIGEGVSSTPLCGQQDYTFHDVQNCINAYNRLWYGFEEVHENFRNLTQEERLPLYYNALRPYLREDAAFGIYGIPDLTLEATGPLEVAQIAVYGVTNLWEHHVHSPPTVRRICPVGRPFWEVYLELVFQDIVMSSGNTIFDSRKVAVCRSTRCQFGQNYLAQYISIREDVRNLRYGPSEVLVSHVPYPFPTEYDNRCSPFFNPDFSLSSDNSEALYDANVDEQAEVTQSQV